MSRDMQSVKSLQNSVSRNSWGVKTCYLKNTKAMQGNINIIIKLRTW